MRVRDHVRRRQQEFTRGPALLRPVGRRGAGFHLAVFRPST